MKLLMLLSLLLGSVLAEAQKLQEHPSQTEFRKGVSTHQINAFIGGLQVGKTVAGSDAVHHALYTDLLQVPPQAAAFYPEVWILSRSYVLVEAAWDTYVARHGDTVMPADECRKARLSLKSNVHWLYPNVAGGKPIRVRLRTTDDPENLRATPNVIVAWGDEVAHWKELAVKNLYGRSVVTMTKYIFTTTPKGRNWLFRDIAIPGGYKDGKVYPELRLEDDINVVVCRSIDNPWVNREYLKKLRLKFGPEYAAQELDALFTANQGYVYDFDRVTHMGQPIPSSDPEDYKSRVVGVDPGYGDPYAASLWLKDWEDHWWLADEMYLPSKAIVDDAFPKLKHWYDKWNVQAFYVDKRRPSDWQSLRRKGLNALPNVDVFGEDDRRTIMPMIRMVQRLFREGRIHFSKHCEWHAEEYEAYAFKDSEEKNAGENPIDFKDHTCDADRYAIVSVDALPEDRRPRYRQGNDLMPKPRGPHPGRDPRQKVVIPDAKTWLAAMDKKMDARERLGRRGRRQDV